jgi:hypothetical protein
VGVFRFLMCCRRSLISSRDCSRSNFTRAQREGDWELYLDSFRATLPYFFRYDHPNYAKWGSVFIAEMEQLPYEVLQEFKKGNFVNCKVERGRFQ